MKSEVLSGKNALNDLNNATQILLGYVTGRRVLWVS